MSMMASVTIGPGDGKKTFTVDGVPFQRGEYHLVVSGNSVGLIETSYGVDIVSLTPYYQYYNLSAVAYASFEDLINDFKTFIFT